MEIDLNMEHDQEMIQEGEDDVVGGGWWYVVHSSDEHNHPLLIKPSLTKFLRSHRNIPVEEVHFLRILHACNIPTSRQMQLMARFYENLENVPYIAKDIANLRASFRREHHHHDMQDTLAYFDRMKSEDKDFFYKIKLDEEDRVENLFWVDGASRRAYTNYHDCVSFDTTYLTNEYKMPFAPFIGINNHGQSVQFGCAFIRNELSASFEWMFRMFLEAMDGIAPTNIITDQDVAMRTAIVQDKILNVERKAESDTALSDPDFWCRNPIEKQMAKAYTRNIFYRFQREMMESMSYHCTHKIAYQFELTILDGPVPHYGYRNYSVMANWEEGTFSCNCCKFERDGILCCHILKVMTQIGIHQIPEAYILKRWTWDAEEALGEPGGKDKENSGKKEMPQEAWSTMVFASLREDFTKVAKIACRSQDGNKIVRTHLKAMKQELDVLARREEKKAREAAEENITMPSSSAPTEPDKPATAEKKTRRRRTSKPITVPTTSPSLPHISTNSHIQNPPVSNTKGRPQESTNKAPLDLATKKGKLCGHCKKPGKQFRSVRKD
ncbi:hypothetical protein ACQ4PT_032703 [Festuca glaucescens]